MRIKNKLAGVTLLELMIVISIVSVLSVILFRTFTSISEISFRLQQQKNVTNEIISTTQILQNYADRNTIDYKKYGELLIEKNGISDVLYLSGEDGQISIFSSGDCYQTDYAFSGKIPGSGCSIYILNENNRIQITDTSKIYLSKIVFKVMPFADGNDYIQGKYKCDELSKCLIKPAFWLVGKGFNPRYQSGMRANNINIPFQLFFNTK